MNVMDIKKIFGENLKFYRKAKHLSQEQLSEKVGISVKHLSSIERGLNFTSGDLLEKLAVSIDVPVYYLFVNQREIIYNDNMLNTIDKIVEKKLTKVIEEIKTDVRKNNLK
jgi:transcriptional regulator with XRE-family HTH domain